MSKEFKSVHIDLKKRIFEINGEPIPPWTNEFMIKFGEDGWEMEVVTNTYYWAEEKRPLEQQALELME